MKAAVIAVAAILLSGIFNITHAQGPTGGINGQVTDSTGAVVAGAIVEATNTATSEKRNTSTDDEGLYSLPSLQVGLYIITATASGFSPTTIQDVKVSISFITTIDLELSTKVSDVVVVTAPDAPRPNLNDQQQSTLINNPRIVRLPLLGRDPFDLILLSPGVVQSNTDIGGFAVNGSRERNHNIQLDGIDNNDPEVPAFPGGTVNIDIDSIQEFRVITHNFNAEYGRNSGAIINYITRSGSNEWHGSLYVFNRTSTFAARSFFDTTGEPDPLHRNQFGGTIGGPIRQNRAFFFFSYQGDRFTLGVPQLRTVPSLEARRGILLDPQFGLLDLVDRNNIFGRQPNQAILQILSLYPLPNDPLTSVRPGVFEGYRFISQERDSTNDFTTRIDYRLSEKHNLYTRYSFNRRRIVAPNETFPGFNDNSRSLQQTQFFSLNFTSVFTPTSINEFRFGFNRLNIPEFGPGDGGVPTTLDDRIKAALSSEGAQLGKGFGGRNGETISLIRNFSLTNFAAENTQRRFAGTTTLADSFTFVRGGHTFKAGFEARFIYSNNELNVGRSESILFNSNGVPLLEDNNGTPITDLDLNNFAAFFYGIVRRQFQTQFFNKDGARMDSDLRGFRIREVEAFFQDTWKVRPNFTLNYGFRYEFKGVPYEVNGLLSTLVDQDPSGFTPVGGFRFVTVGKNSENEDLQLYDDDLNNFAPRFGFTWDPFKTGRTSVRGGYGVFYDRIYGNLLDNVRNPPFQIDAVSDYDFTNVRDLRRLPTAAPRPRVFDNSQLLVTVFPLAGERGNNPYQRRLRLPYMQHFNFGVQHEFRSNLLVEVDYVGSKGTKLLRVLNGTLPSVRRKNLLTGSNNPIFLAPNLNYPNAVLSTAFGGVILPITGGFSTYHGLTLRVTKSISSTTFGIGEVQTAYTYGHAIDNVPDLVHSSTLDNLNNLRRSPVNFSSLDFAFPIDSSGFEGGFNKPERGEPNFDTRHRLVTNFYYEFPFRFGNNVVNSIFKGLSMSGIFQAQTGQPFSVEYSLDTQGTVSVNPRTSNAGRSYARFANGRSGIAPNPNINPRLQTGPPSNIFLGPNNFGDIRTGIIFAPGQGDVPRSAFTGPGFFQADFMAAKRFSISERHQLQLRAEFFNLFNCVNLGQPVNDLLDARFGQSLTVVGPPRIVQFVVRYNF